MQRTLRAVGLLICSITAALVFCSFDHAKAQEKIAGQGDVFQEIPVKGMVTMLDLGADKCIPCKMMAPIIAKMEKAYEGKAAIVFIDVWKHRDQATRFGIRAIPTQIFFDRDGQEVYRHVGFMTEEAIVKQLKNMGIPDV